MRRDRFMQICSIRFCDPYLPSTGSLTKEDHFLDVLSHAFRTNYVPGEYIAVDEFLSKWKRRLKFGQYIPSKRERYGVKLFMCCESCTGYLWRFIIYTGADTVYHPPLGVNASCVFGLYGNPTEVVLSLIDGLYESGYKVVVDNYYTSPELFLVLYANRTDTFGTVKRKKGLPGDFWQWNPPKEYLNALPPILPPIVKFCGPLLAFRWNDAYKSKKTKIVSCLSTKHTGELVETEKLNFASKRKVVKPDLIVEYNSSMGGVDNLSRILNPYSCQRICLKWYPKLTELFFDICIYNSFVIFKELNDTKMSNLDFRIELVNVIITYHSYTKGKNNLGNKFEKGREQPLRLVERHFRRQHPQQPKKQKFRSIRCTALGERKETTYFSIM